MNGQHNWTGFSWKRGLFASQSEGLYHYNAPTKDKAQKKLKTNALLSQKQKIKTNGIFLHDRMYHSTPISP